MDGESGEGGRGYGDMDYGYIELTALSHGASSGGVLVAANKDGWSLAQPDPEILAGLNAWPDGLQILFRERLRAHISQGVSDPQIEQIVEASRVSAFDLHFE
jgi:hypothetical protein